MEFLPSLLAASPNVIAVGCVALALTMLTTMLGVLAYKAVQQYAARVE